MTQPKPTITGTTHTLPFHQLSPRDFERMCLWLVQREGFERAEHLGAAGHEQGRDIVAWREGQLWAFQCKRVQHFGPKDAEAEVAKVMGLPEDLRPTALVFLVTRDIADTTRRRAQTRCGGEMACYFWALTELDERVKRHIDILEEFFQLAPVEPLPPVLHQLPADLADFTGREWEIRQILDLLTADTSEPTTAAISAIGGMGGIGKTALAVHLAHRLLHRYPDAQIVVDLAGTTDRPLAPHDAMRQVVHAFQPQCPLPDDPQDLPAFYRTTLSGRRAFILFDDAADAAQVRPLLPPAPCGVIVTSRRAIALSGMKTFNLNLLSESEARTFLLQILGSDRATQVELDEIARLCGRLPLALRVAGNFIAVHTDWTPTEYAQALSDERDRLARLVHEDLDVRATLGLSATQLVRYQPDLAAAWQMLSVFPAPFNRAAAAAVWQVEEPEARDWLSELTARSLLIYDAEGQLYRLHDLMRPVSREVFAHCPSEHDAEVEHQRLAEAAVRHADHYLELGAQANDLYEQGGEHVLEGLRQFDIAWPHLYAAWIRIQKRRDKTASKWLVDFPGLVASVFRLRQPPLDQVSIFNKALSTARATGNRLAEARYLDELGRAYAALGNTRLAVESLEQAIEVYQEIERPSGVAMALHDLGGVYNDIRDSRRAIECFEQARAIYGENPSQSAEGNLLCDLGIAHLYSGNTRRAIRHFEQALVIHREIGDRWAEGNDLTNLGNAHKRLRDSQSALKYYEKALTIRREMRDRRGEENVLSNLWSVYLDQGDTQKAIECLEQALTIAQEIEDQRGEGSILYYLGKYYLNQGDTQKAIECLERALTIAQEVKDRQGEGNILYSLGKAYDSRGDTRRAIEYLEGAREVFEEIDDHPGLGSTLHSLGIAYDITGDSHKAIECLKRARAIYQDTEDRHDEGHVLCDLGAVHVHLGDPHPAIHYFEQALVVHREFDDRWAEGNDLTNLGNAYALMKDPHRAIKYYEEALTIRREIEDQQGEGITLGSLGNNYFSLGDSQAAIKYLEQAHEIARETGNRRFEGAWLNSLGRVHASLGDLHRAIQYYEQAVMISREIGARRMEGNGLYGLVRACYRLGDIRRSVDYCEQALHVFEAIGHPDVEQVRELLPILKSLDKIGAEFWPDGDS